MNRIIFKDLTVDNLFDFCNVLDAVGINSVLGAFDKREINALQNAKNSMENVGIVITMKIIGIIVKNISKAKSEICTFLAGCTEFEDGDKTTADDFLEMKITPFVKLLKEFSKKEDLADFFGAVAGFRDTAPSDLRSSSMSGMQTPTIFSAEQ